jgi:hypothetical protein
MRKLPVVLLLACFVPACSLFWPEGTGGVTVRAEAPWLYAANHTGERIYYFIVGSETATLLDWMPSLDPATSIRAGSTAKIGYDAIYRGPEETEAVFYWWHAVERGGQRQPGEVHAIVVSL